MDLVLIGVKAVDLAYSPNKKNAAPLEIIMAAREFAAVKDRLCVGSPPMQGSRIRARPGRFWYFIEGFLFPVVQMGMWYKLLARVTCQNGKGLGAKL